MATIYYEQDVKPELIQNARVGIIGYGSQGHAHALNLRDSGVEVRIGLHEGSQSRIKATDAGFVVESVAGLSRWSEVLMFCTPDVPMAQIYEESVRPHLTSGKTLLFAHGFNIHFKRILPPSDVNVAMVSPKGPGYGVRSEYLRGAGLPALVAVHQDADGNAEALALAYAWGIGCARAALLRTTFEEETVTDLFGEQTVLCGGIPELIKNAYRTLVDAGYQPEVAYFECLHETKLIVDLLYSGGLTHMRQSISDTAEWGGFVSGSRVVGDSSRHAMQSVLAEIQSGEFAARWVAESENGYAQMDAFRGEETGLGVESIGREVRSLIPFLKPK